MRFLHFSPSKINFFSSGIEALLVKCVDLKGDCTDVFWPKTIQNGGERVLSFEFRT